MKQYWVTRDGTMLEADAPDDAVCVQLGARCPLACSGASARTSAIDFGRRVHVCATEDGRTNSHRFPDTMVQADGDHLLIITNDQERAIKGTPAQETP